MPTIFRQHGLRFVSFTDDHAPPHVHVSGRGNAKIMIDGAQEAILVRACQSRMLLVRAML